VSRLDIDLRCTLCRITGPKCRSLTDVVDSLCGHDRRFDRHATSGSVPAAPLRHSYRAEVLKALWHIASYAVEFAYAFLARHLAGSSLIQHAIHLASAEPSGAPC